MIYIALDTLVSVNRLKYGDIVKHDATSGASSLELTDVTAADVGYYTCRASNDYSAIISAAATVLVEGSYVYTRFHSIRLHVHAITKENLTLKQNLVHTFMVTS